MRLANPVGTMQLPSRSSQSGRPGTPSPRAALPLWTCPDCGGAVTNPRHVRCDACIASDPAQAPEIRGRRGGAIAARKRALAAWDEAHGDEPYDPELFRRDILPRLGTVRLSEIVEATGMSKAFASQVRAGKWKPHVSAWPALAELVGVDNLGDVAPVSRIASGAKRSRHGGGPQHDKQQRG